MKTFSHGIHPPGNKERTKDLPIVRFDAPEKVYIPLQQHIGKEAAPIVAVGDTVKKGQVVGIVEAMKLMNEIESEYDGIVEAVLVKDGETVEYGQPLFRIR